jgi:prenyltransferase beta subunit
LRNCKKINRKYVAFSSTPKNNYKNLYLCTLYFAIRPFLLKDRFKNLTNLLLGDGGELFSRDEREKVINFICDCWNEKEGGFAISPFAISPFEGVPTIIHTKFALKLLCEYFERDIDFTTRSGKKVQISDIKNFLNSCERNSGYSFRSSYQPNIYALRNAVDIMKTLKKKNKIDESEFTNFKEKTMGILKKYYFHSSGYQGYPKENE